MGTSNSYSGPNNNTPLIPTWLEPDMPPIPEIPISTPPAGEGSDEVEHPDLVLPLIIHPEVAPLPDPYRFQLARMHMTHFISSGGTDSVGFRKAISHYVSTSTGGSHQAARRMSSSRKSGSKLLSFISEAIAHGAQEALRELHLENLAGLPIEDIFLGMMDYVCPDGGTIDEGIARDAFIETIADLAENGIVDLNSLTQDQMQTVLELYVMHTIVNRLYNDIATKAIQLPVNAHMAIQIQAQIQDFVRRGVSDAIAAKHDVLRVLTKDVVQRFINQVYEDVYKILQILGERETTKL